MIEEDQKEWLALYSNYCTNVLGYQNQNTKLVTSVGPPKRNYVTVTSNKLVTQIVDLPLLCCCVHCSPFDPHFVVAWENLMKKHFLLHESKLFSQKTAFTFKNVNRVPISHLGWCIPGGSGARWTKEITVQVEMSRLLLNCARIIRIWLLLLLFCWTKEITVPVEFPSWY